MSGGQIRAAETKGEKSERKAKRRFVKTGGVLLLEGAGWGGFGGRGSWRKCENYWALL